MGFAKAAQAAGVRIERRHGGHGHPRRRRPCDRRHDDRVATIHAPIVVNAAGPHARAIGRMAGADVPVDPYRRHIFIAQAPAAGVPASRIMVIDFETTFYFHREGAGILFGMGGKDETPTFDMTVQWDFLPQVIDVAVRRLPALADAAISHAWAGLYEVTPDANPIIGPSHEVDRSVPDRRIQRPRVSAFAGGRPHPGGRDRRPRPAFRPVAVCGGSIHRPWRRRRTLRGVGASGETGTGGSSSRSCWSDQPPAAVQYRISLGLVSSGHAADRVRQAVQALQFAMREPVLVSGRQIGDGPVGADRATTASAVARRVRHQSPGGPPQSHTGCRTPAALRSSAAARRAAAEGGGRSWRRRTSDRWQA